MLVSTLAVIGDRIVEGEDLAGRPFPVCTLPPGAQRGLLVTLLTVEDDAFHLAHVSVTAYALSVDDAGAPTGVDLIHPLTALTASEQAPLRRELVRQSWSAWARAPQHVRAFLGQPDPPLLLAEAARRLAIPLATLANAAVHDRVPTIRAGDRHLVYPATIVEAQDRGLLHFQRGRPRRRAPR